MDYSEGEDVDIESDEDDLDSAKNSGGPFLTPAERRAHHNALERRRRDHIKDSFSGLRDSVPSLHGEKVVGARLTQTSRAQILKRAAEYIQVMRKKNSVHQNDIEDLKKQNQLLDQQIETLETMSKPSYRSNKKKTAAVRQLEKTKTGNFSSAAMLESPLITNPKGDAVSAFDGGSGSESSSEPETYQQGRTKKMRTSSPATSSSGT